MTARRQFLAMLRKDVLVELRTREMLLSMFLFAVLALVVFHYAFAANGGDVSSSAGGMLWVVFLFAALLGLNRSFGREKDEGCLDGLLLCPVDRVLVFVAKAVANLVFLLVIQVLVVPVFAVFFAGPGPGAHAGGFVLVVLLTDIGICVLGTLLATMAAGTRARDVLPPVAFLPRAVPLLIAATSATADIVAGHATLGDVLGRLGFMAAYDAVFLVVAYGTYDYLLGD
jgi:heme exporter protein B